MGATGILQDDDRILWDDDGTLSDFITKPRVTRARDVGRGDRVQMESVAPEDRKTPDHRYHVTVVAAAAPAKETE